VESANLQLINRLAGELGDAGAAAMVSRIVAAAHKPAAILALLDELEAVSAKAVRAAIEALAELDRRAGYSQVHAWLDLGVALAASSGAIALKYFKESPLILGLIERTDRQAAVLALGLELAEHDANVSWEFLKTAPQIATALPVDQWPDWLDIGLEIARVEPIVGLEYIRQIPALTPVLAASDVRQWLMFGMKLIMPNSLGKPDYLAAMEFLRTSPAILSDIEAPLRSPVISVGAQLAERAPETGIAWLAESPRLLRHLPSPAWRIKVVQYGALVAEKDADAAVAYLRRGSELVALIGEGPLTDARFEEWFKAGMEVLEYSPEGARAYFATESLKALSSVEQALSGVPLRQVARRIKLVVQGLCGSDVAIIARPEAFTTPISRPIVSADGKTIALPALLRRYPTARENERLYLVMAAHEAGHVEFGTYTLRISSLLDLLETVCRRYGRPRPAALESLAALFRLYPHPRLMQDLWTILEDARVESFLQREYPGLRRDLAQFAADTILPRDPAHGLTVRELIADCLLRLSVGESMSSAVPHAVTEEVSILWNLCQPVLTPDSTAERSVRIAHEVYVRMEELLACRASLLESEQTAEDLAEAASGQTAPKQADDEYRPVNNALYRGEMRPEMIRGDVDQSGDFRSEVQPPGGGSSERRTAQTGRFEDEYSPSGDVLGGGRSLPEVVEELLTLDVHPPLVRETAVPGEQTIRYPEWDYMLRDYRVNWCRVLERPADSGSDETVSATLSTHRSDIRSLKRVFESLRPPAFRRLAGQADGEDLDLDAVVRRAAEQAAGFEGSDRVYVRREKKDRNVAVALLVDVSGSTGRQLESGRRVIDVERDSLVLLCEALEAVGDQYALYAYSGQGRGSVDVLAIKGFDERLGPATAQRLGGLSPRQQNRDGAAIRHAVAALMRREVKTRLLMLLSDGRPLDDDYKEEYALEDTKAALREADRQGIHPFCVTIDREADSYMRRMYGDVQYAVIDRVESLPARLPRIYRRFAT
jgi:nitric oxide reductase NorD protein